MDKSPKVPPAPLKPERRSLNGVEPRVLGLDPGTRFLGVAVIEGDDLLYYAVRELRRIRPTFQLTRATSDVVTDVIARFQPDVIAFETSYYVQQMSSLMLQDQEREIRRRGEEAGLKVVSYSPLYIRQQLCADAYVTKQMVARVLLQRFPELAAYRTNQTPRSERYWLNMFDALAVAVVAAREVTRESSGNGGERGAQAA